MARMARINAALAFAVALNLGLAAPADAEGRLHNLCGWTVRSPQEAFDRLAKQKNVRGIQRTSEYISYHDQVADRVWTFTVAGHSAHPAVICRYPTSDGIQMNVVCGGTKAICDELVRQFEEQTRKVTR